MFYCPFSAHFISNTFAPSYVETHTLTHNELHVMQLREGHSQPDNCPPPLLILIDDKVHKQITMSPASMHFVAEKVAALDVATGVRVLPEGLASDLLPLVAIGGWDNEVRTVDSGPIQH